MPETIDIKNPLELRNFKYISEDLPICVEEVPVDSSLIRVISSCFHDDFICARILKGTIVIDIDGNQQLLQKNDFLFINSNHVYSISEVQEPGFIRVMFAKPSTLSNPLLDRKINRMISDVKFSSTIIHPINPLFYADMDAIYDLSRSRPQEFEFKILSHYVNQLRQIYRIYQHTNPEETVNHDANYDALREMMAFIGESYRITKDYAIFMFSGSYDVPVKGADKQWLEGSEEVYDFLVCTISPLTGQYEPGMPEFGFLFPAFSERSSDDRKIYIFNQNPENVQEEVMRKILGR